MDFSSSRVIRTSPVKGSPSPQKSDTVRKHVTVTVCLLLIDQGDDTYYPAGFKVTNSFQVKTLLETSSRYPCGTLFSVMSKILYPDKLKDFVRSCDFPEDMLEENSDEELRKTSWMPSSVITLVSDRIPEKVMEAFELVKTLDKKVVTNTLGEPARR